MNFLAQALLMIFLHVAPNAAGAAYSIHQQHGIHIERQDHSHPSALIPCSTMYSRHH